MRRTLARHPILAFSALFLGLLLSGCPGGQGGATSDASEGAIDAFKVLPLHKAIWFATYRILRCNPWGGQGYDPVPGTVFLNGKFVYEEEGQKVTSLKDVVEK